jgi:SSS family solute:Na+ symporter
MYGSLSWQGQQGYNSSATSAHEAKMSSVLGGFRGMSQGLFFFVVPVLIYVFMNHEDYQSISLSVTETLAQLDTDTLRSQMRGPIVLSKVLPVGLLGAFAALMLCAFVSTHDTYLHSWATILVQDVIMPFRSKPFDKETHLKVLRYAIFGVAVFIFLFSLLFQQNQKIALFFAITAAIFAGGSGAVIIGGLYWEKGTTAAAWGAMIIGAFVSVSGVLVKQVSLDWLMDMNSLVQLKTFLKFIRDINGQEYWGISMALAAITYILISLLTNKKPFNMDKLLNRGKYVITDEKEIVNKTVSFSSKIFLIGKEFTKIDKLIYVVNYVWTGLWTLVFIIGTIYNLNNNVSDHAWMIYWKYYIFIHIGFSLITIVWFTIGGFNDLKSMMKRLKTAQRDHRDDGWVDK